MLGLKDEAPWLIGMLGLKEDVPWVPFSTGSILLLLLVALFLLLLLAPLLLPLLNGRAGLLLPGWGSAALLAGFCCTMQFRARTTCTQQRNGGWHERQYSAALASQA